MSSSSSSVVVVSALVCGVLFVAAVGFASAAPDPQQLQRDDGSAPAAGLGAVLWSVLDDCFGDDSAEPTAVCLKSKALTALDRALSKPNLVIADGVALTARAGKSLQVDPTAEKADRAALDAVKDSDRKHALLDDMLVARMDRLMSSRTIVLDGSAGQEGRKKKDKAMQQAMMMAGMTAAAVMGPMAIKMIMMMSAKALMLSKIALLLSGITVLKKLFQSQKGGQESEAPPHHYGRSMQLDAHDAAYSGQKQ